MTIVTIIIIIIITIIIISIVINYYDDCQVGGEVEGKITRKEFENYYYNVSASIFRDEVFESMIRNAWHFNSNDDELYYNRSKNSSPRANEPINRNLSSQSKINYNTSDHYSLVDDQNYGPRGSNRFNRSDNDIDLDIRGQGPDTYNYNNKNNYYRRPLSRSRSPHRREAKDYEDDIRYSSRPNSRSSSPNPGMSRANQTDF